MTLPSDAQQRKSHPIFSGVLMYFPDAIAEVANASWVGNEQHHAGEPLHWDKNKSTDEADCLLRHLMQAGTRDVDGVRHTAKVAWRALALLQRELESETPNVKPDWFRKSIYAGSLASHPAATPFKEQWVPTQCAVHNFGNRCVGVANHLGECQFEFLR